MLMELPRRESHRLTPRHPSHMWELEVSVEETPDCRTLAHLGITDQLTETTLAITVERSIGGFPSCQSSKAAPCPSQT